VIPGKAVISAGTTQYQCFSTVSSLVGGPKTLTTYSGVSASATITTQFPQATRPVIIEAPQVPQFVYMGCYDQHPNILLPGNIGSPGNPLGTSWEWCAKRCWDNFTQSPFIGIHSGK